jgi:hypothetical protein
VGLSDVAGIFSRKFIIGCFVPAFFGSFLLSLLVDTRALPAPYRDASDGTQVLIIGAVALLLGLLLSGLHYPLVRFLEGYWLINEPPRRLSSAIGTRKTDRWIPDRQRLVSITQDPERSNQRTRAAVDLHRLFTADDDLVLPTKLGNVIRAFETHPRLRYGLDGIAIWPRIALMLSDGERAEIEDAATDFAFWVNSLVVAGVCGAVLFAERLWHRPAGALAAVVVVMAIPLTTALLCMWMYRQAVSAAIRWGDPVRAAFDVHRLDLYDKLGVRRPTTNEEERRAARAINRLLLFAEPVPNALRAMSGVSGVEHALDAPASQASVSAPVVARTGCGAAPTAAGPQRPDEPSHQPRPGASPRAEHNALDDDRETREQL